MSGNVKLTLKKERKIVGDQRHTPHFGILVWSLTTLFWLYLVCQNFANPKAESCVEGGWGGVGVRERDVISSLI